MPGSSVRRESELLGSEPAVYAARVRGQRAAADGDCVVALRRCPSEPQCSECTGMSLWGILCGAVREWGHLHLCRDKAGCGGAFEKPVSSVGIRLGSVRQVPVHRRLVRWPYAESAVLADAAAGGQGSARAATLDDRVPHDPGKCCGKQAGSCTMVYVSWHSMK